MIISISAKAATLAAIVAIALASEKLTKQMLFVAVELLRSVYRHSLLRAALV